MPNINEVITLERENLAIASGPTYTYNVLTGIDNSRSHSSQIQVLFYFTHFQDGTAVSSYTWENWYDPYVLPLTADDGSTVLTFSPSVKNVTITNTGNVEKTDANGTSGLFLPDFPNGDSVTLRRSQDISNISHVFGAGSRVTSTALNNVFSQLFESIQELEDRVLKLESEG